MRIKDLCRDMQVVPGGRADYERLAACHYRGGSLGPYAAIYALRPPASLAGWLDTETIGVIVYTMPTVGLELRNGATGGLFAGLDRATRTRLLNRNFRRIARVIIEPRFRSLGLAVRLVRETMPMLGVAVIEAQAVMGRVNPFFAKAGMTAYEPGPSERSARMAEALAMVGIGCTGRELIDPAAVQAKLDALEPRQRRFIEGEIRRFLGCYGRARHSEPGPARTALVLSKLAFRPVYYIWFNPDVKMELP